MHWEKQPEVSPRPTLPSIDSEFWIANYRGTAHVVDSFGPQWEQLYRIGRPRATKKHTEQELTNMGLIGLYSKPQ